MAGAAQNRLDELKYQLGGRILLNYHLIHVRDWRFCC